jgi:uncharacterized membrane protein
MADIAFLRALHIFTVVIWIGTFAMVKLLVLPAITRGELGPNSIRAFKISERRFSWHARIAILIVRLTAFVCSPDSRCGTGSARLNCGGCTQWLPLGTVCAAALCG